LDHGFRLKVDAFFLSFGKAHGSCKFSALGFVIDPSAPPKVNDEERFGLEGEKGLCIGGGLYEDLVIGLPLFTNDKVSAPNVEVDGFP
jgi:hypothetical protein